jgi:hypothetical protein
LLFFRIIEKNYIKKVDEEVNLKKELMWKKKDLQVIELKTKRKGLVTDI